MVPAEVFNLGASFSSIPNRTMLRALSSTWGLGGMSSGGDPKQKFARINSFVI